MLTRDFLHEYLGYQGCRSHCFVQIHQDERPKAMPVVIVTELPDNPGTSITNCAEQLAAEIYTHCLSHRDGALPMPFIWIEHYPPSRDLRLPDRYALVTFDDYRLRVEVLTGGRQRMKLGKAHFHHIPVADVQALIAPSPLEVPYA